jgi:hypothetical protein
MQLLSPTMLLVSACKQWHSPKTGPRNLANGNAEAGQIKGIEALIDDLDVF